jgi:FkbM family methyltransferase
VLRTQLNNLRVTAFFGMRRLFFRPELKLVNGFAFELDPRLSLDLAMIRNSSFEPDIEAAIWVARSLRPEGAFLDVGANAGYWTIPLAPIFSSVVAFEPDPEIRKRLSRNLSLNSLTNCAISAIAVSDGPGTASFAVRRTLDNAGAINDGLGSLVKHDSHVRGTLEVQTESLDRFLINFPHTVSLLKIDVEGAEGLVLGGFAGILGSQRPVVISELLFSGNGGNQQTLEERFSLFPPNYRHFWLRQGSFEELKAVSGQNLPDLNVFSFPEEKVSEILESVARQSI